MGTRPTLPPALETLRKLRQTRKFTSEPVSDEALNAILEVARWTGSAKNSQPWEFIVIRDQVRIARIAAMGVYSGFLKGAPLVIALVLDGYAMRSEAYDEGRVSERIMLAAQELGLGSGTGWWGGDEASAAVKQELGVPAEKRLYSGIAIGHPAEASTPAASVSGGRKPLTDLVHYETFGSQSA